MDVRKELFSMMSPNGLITSISINAPEGNKNFKNQTIIISWAEPEYNAYCKITFSMTGTDVEEALICKAYNYFVNLHNNRFIKK